MLTPTIHPNANEDETRKYTHHLRPSRVVSLPFSRPIFPLFGLLAFVQLSQAAIAIVTLYYLFSFFSFGKTFLCSSFYITSASGHMHGSMRKRVEGRDVPTP